MEALAEIDESAETDESVEQIITALDELRPRTKQVFVLCRIRCMQPKAVARRLDISSGAVEKHMIKAIAHLSGRLSPRE